MSYKIAIASSDGIHIDETFGSAKAFHIFEVLDGKYEEVEARDAGGDCQNADETVRSSGCGVAGGGCGTGSGGGCGTGGGCSGGDGPSPRVELLSDCRCIVCRKIGFHIQKQLERRAITAFDVACSVEEALQKITGYFQRMDTHKSLRGIAK